MATKQTQLQIVVDAQNRTQGAFNSLKNNLDGVKKSHEGLVSSMKGIGAAGAVALGGLSLLTKGAIKAGADFEQTEIAFTTMLGSAEQAQKTLRELSQFAAKTPFELTQLQTASKQLLAYGTTADELIPTMRMLGDISAGVGMDKLPQLILAFGQVKAATRLTGMELRQFTEAGVPLLGTLAAQFGVTAAEMTQMISDGKVGFKDVETAMQSLTGEGGRFFNLMERQSTSLGGMWSNFKDQINLTAVTIGTQLMPYLKPMLDKLIEIAKAVGQFATEHPKLSAFLLMATLGIAALTALLLPLAIALPGLIILFGGFATAIGAVTAASILIVGPIMAVVAILGTLAANGYLTKQAWQDVWLGIKTIAAESANAVIRTVESMINFIISGVNKAIVMINKVIAAAQKIPGIGKAVPSIRSIAPVSLGSVDTGLVASKDIAGRGSGAGVGSTILNMAGSVFLSEDVAVDIGNLIFRKLKGSNII